MIKSYEMTIKSICTSITY